MYIFEVNNGNEAQIKRFSNLNEAIKYASKVWEQLDSDNKKVLQLFAIESCEPEPDGEFSFAGQVVWSQDELIKKELQKIGATIGGEQNFFGGAKIYGVYGTPEVLSAARNLLEKEGYCDDTCMVRSDLSRGIGEIRVSAGGDAGFGGFVALPADVSAFCDSLTDMKMKADAIAEAFGVAV